MSCAAPSTAAYDLIGGEAGIEAFVSRLYDIMASKPEAQTIWKWHPQDMDAVKARLAAFLSGWLGGPVHLSAKLRAADDAPAAYGVPDWPEGARHLACLRAGGSWRKPWRMRACASFSTRR